MGSKISFSNQNLSIDEIVYYKQDLERAVHLYYLNAQAYKKFYSYSDEEVYKEKRKRLDELELNAVFMILSSIEAIFRIDFNIRVDEKQKDELSRKFRNISKTKQKGISLEKDILEIWQTYFANFKTLISEYKSALHYRHWLAHGRYWEPKLGRKYDFDSVYVLADNIINNLPLKEVA